MVGRYEGGEAESCRAEKFEGSPGAHHDIGGRGSRPLSLRAPAPCLTVVAGDVGPREASPHGVLDALATPAERRELPAVTAWTEVGKRHRLATDATVEARRLPRVRKGDSTALTANHGPTVLAGQRGGRPAHHEENAAAAGQRFPERAPDLGREWLAPQDAPRIDGRHRRPRRWRGRLPDDRPMTRAPPDLHAGRGR